MFLIRQNRIYHLRIDVPLVLVPIIGKKELRFTLKTGDKRVATRKARVLSTRVHNAFNKLSASRPEVRFMIQQGKLTKNDIHRLIRQYVNESLEEYKFSIDLAAGGNGKPAQSELMDRLDWELLECKLTMKEQQYTQHMGPTVDHLLDGMGRTIDRNSDSYKLLCRELLKANIRITESVMERLKGSSPGADSEAILEELGVDPVEPPPADPDPISSENLSATAEPSIVLSTLISEYQTRQVQSNRWSDVTVRNHEPKLKALVQFIGDRPVNTVTIDDMRNFGKVLELLPPGFARMATYQDLAGITPSALEGKHKRKLDPTTRRDYLNLAKSLFTYAYENQYIQSNPVIGGIIPPKKKQTRSQRDAFTVEDLTRIFDPDIFLKWSEGHPARYYIPLILLYTGCRLEEVASLYRTDVFQHEGLWCIDINNDNGRKVKNQNAIRSVPLHPVLVERFRFPEYVQGVKHARVFPELTPVNFKFGHEFSKRFGYYLRNKVGIKARTKSLHSFRHSATDHLYKKLVQESLIEELTGRAGKTETRKRYAKGYRGGTLYEECIIKLDYGVNWSELETPI